MPHDEALTRPPISDRGGHALDATCTSESSPPNGDLESEIDRLIDELASLTAELLIEGKLNTEKPKANPTAA